MFLAFREVSVNDLQMKELQDQLEAEQYFSVSKSYDFWNDSGSEIEFH